MEKSRSRLHPDVKSKIASYEAHNEETRKVISPPNSPTNRNSSSQTSESNMILQTAASPERPTPATMMASQSRMDRIKRQVASSHANAKMKGSTPAVLLHRRSSTNHPFQPYSQNVTQPPQARESSKEGSGLNKLLPSHQNISNNSNMSGPYAGSTVRQQTSALLMRSQEARSKACKRPVEPSSNNPNHNNLQVLRRPHRQRSSLQNSNNRNMQTLIPPLLVNKHLFRLAISLCDNDDIKCNNKLQRLLRTDHVNRSNQRFSNKRIHHSSDKMHSRSF